MHHYVVEGLGEGVAEGVGLGVADGVGEGVEEGLGDADGVGLGVAEGVGDALGDGVGVTTGGLPCLAKIAFNFWINSLMICWSRPLSSEPVRVCSVLS